MSLREPLQFRPRPLPKVWGGRRLNDFVPGGLSIDGPVGEVWEIADRDEASSEVQGGGFAGRRHLARVPRSRSRSGSISEASVSWGVLGATLRAKCLAQRRFRI